MAKRNIPFGDQLRRAIDRSGKTRYRIAQDTGINESALCNFMAGRRGMSLKAINVLWAYLDLRMEQPRAVSKKAR